MYLKSWKSISLRNPDKMTIYNFWSGQKRWINPAWLKLKNKGLRYKIYNKRANLRGSWAFTQASKHNISKSSTLYSTFESKKPVFFKLMLCLVPISMCEIYVLGQDDTASHSKDRHISQDFFFPLSFQTEPFQSHHHAPCPPRPTPANPLSWPPPSRLCFYGTLM